MTISCLIVVCFIVSFLIKAFEENSINIIKTTHLIECSGGSNYPNNDEFHFI